MAAALAAEKANWSYSVEIEDLVVLDRSVTLLENCDLHIGYERGLTVPAGCTLNLGGYMDIFGTVTVEGTLVNRERTYVYYDKGGILNFAAGSIYDGRGEIVIMSETITNPAVAVPAPGYMSWKPVEPTQAMADVVVYKVGQEEAYSRHGWKFDSMDVPEWRSIDSFAMDDPESGTYYFTVTSTGDGINYFDSDTAVSDPWTYVKPDAKLGSCSNLTELVENVGNQLDNVISDSGSMTDDEIRGAVQSLDTNELKSAMLADQDVVENIAVLEDQVGGAAPVEVTNDANAFDPGKVSIVGANLNNAESAEDPIKLVIDKPEKDHVIDAAYDNSVAVKFAMDLENVEDTENLAVPVKITLPIPANINPAFLVILHYHANGTVEEISMADLHIINRGGENYVSFVLTSFSDFIMTQYTQDTPPQEATVPMHRLYNPNSGEHFYTGSVEERDMLVSAGWIYEGIGWFGLLK